MQRFAKQYWDIMYGFRAVWLRHSHNLCSWQNVHKRSTVCSLLSGGKYHSGWFHETQHHVQQSMDVMSQVVPVAGWTSWARAISCFPDDQTCYGSGTSKSATKPPVCQTWVWNGHNVYNFIVPINNYGQHKLPHKNDPSVVLALVWLIHTVWCKVFHLRRFSNSTNVRMNIMEPIKFTKQRFGSSSFKSVPFQILLSWSIRTCFFVTWINHETLKLKVIFNQKLSVSSEQKPRMGQNQHLLPCTSAIFALTKGAKRLPCAKPFTNCKKINGKNVIC